MTSSREPTFSVCIPYYRGHETIERCVSSVHAQTLGSGGSGVAAGQVEIVITSDDSSEEAKQCLARMAETYQARVIFNPSRLGLTCNWQAALELGQGEIVTLLHQDDWYLPGCLQTVADRFASDERLMVLGVNALLDGDPARVQVKLESYQRKGRDICSRPEAMEIVFAPSAAFFRGKMLRSQKILYHEAYAWSPERELYYNLARDWPGMAFAFHAEPLICRGLSSGQFSVTNEHLRVLDVLAFWERIGTSEPEKAAAFGEHSLELALQRMAVWVRSARSTEPDTIVNGWRWLSRVYSDPRLLQLVRANPAPWSAYLKEIAKGGVDIGALSYDCLRLHLPDGPEKHGALEILEQAMQPDAAKLGRAKARVDRILADDQFKAPVLICGFHHSGTRLLAQVLEAIGVFQRVRGPTHEWPYLQHLNTIVLPGWMDPVAIAAFDGAAAPKAISPEVLALRLSIDGYVGGQPWGQKDPRNSVTAEAWLDAFPKARILNIVRDPLDVLGTLAPDYASFSPGGAAPQREPAFWSQLWCSYLETTRRAMAKAEHAAEIRFEDLCGDPIEVMGSVIAALDLDCSIEPQDIAGLDIMPRKVGAHREWLEQGKLTAEELEVLRDRTSPIDLSWRPRRALEGVA